MCTHQAHLAFFHVLTIDFEPRQRSPHSALIRPARVPPNEDRFHIRRYGFSFFLCGMSTAEEVARPSLCRAVKEHLGSMNPDVADILAVVQAAPLLTVIDRFCVRRHGLLGFFIGGEVEVIVYLATEALSYFLCATEFSKFNSNHIGADPKNRARLWPRRGKVAEPAHRDEHALSTGGRSATEHEPKNWSSQAVALLQVSRSSSTGGTSDIAFRYPSQLVQLRSILSSSSLLPTCTAFHWGRWRRSRTSAPFPHHLLKVTVFKFSVFECVIVSSSMAWAFRTTVS